MDNEGIEGLFFPVLPLIETKEAFVSSLQVHKLKSTVIMNMENICG